MNSNILGLDLANQIGLSVIDSTTNRLLFSTTRKLAKANQIQQRLLNLYLLLRDTITNYQPSEIAIEDVFLPAKTSRKTAKKWIRPKNASSICKPG